jgi:hypothetical protein
MTETTPDTNLSKLEAEFERAWADTAHTRARQPDHDVNQVLAAWYHTSKPLVFTRTMLWDVEVRKAYNPGEYIPFVVRARSAHVWGRRVDAGGEYFLRSSEQRLWLRPDEYGTVLERVYLNHQQQKATFIGASAVTDADGHHVRAGSGQPIFHVEHSVGGSETRPLNRWRIVHLTRAVDDRLLEVFSGMAREVWLPEYIAIYMQRDPDMEVSRREA